MANWIQELVSRPWAFWLLLALLAGILELAIPCFTFAFVSVGAAVALLLSLRWGWPVQASGFTVALIVSVIFLRPRLLARLGRSHPMPSRAQSLIGARGEVTEAIDPATGQGRVLVNGQDWAARSLRPLSVAQLIEVEGHDGIVLVVREN